IISPTINLLEAAPGVPNSQGITKTIATVTGNAGDYILWYDIYAGMFNLVFTGNSWTLGAAAYPATQPNGAKCWGQLRYAVTVFTPEPQCFTDFEPFIGDAMPFRTSNPSGLPDSVRLYFNHTQECYRFSVTLGCNSNAGGYFDNVSLAFVD